MFRAAFSKALAVGAVVVLAAACVPASRPPVVSFHDALETEAESVGLTPFYQDRDFAPLWLDGAAVSPRGRALAAVLLTADGDGLYPGDLLGPEIRADLASNGPSGLARAETRLSAGLQRYLDGIGAAGTPLSEAAWADDPAAYLSTLLPWGEDYRRLRQAYVVYRGIAETGGWPALGGGPTLKPGMDDPRIARLRGRLAATGDLRPDTKASTLFDDALDRAVRRFQARHGLDVDGVVGPDTRAALDVPAALRAASIAANLARLRALAPVLSGSGIVVNVAGAELRLLRNGEEVLRSRVIVGRDGWPTPLLSGAVTEIEINPYWTVPPRIARLEVVPKIRRDPGYLKDKNMKVLSGWSAGAEELDPAQIDWTSNTVFRLKLRQEPGPANPLGYVKFVFPNSHDVYLHDTPARGLFERADRDLSHGCVRVERAFDLAASLLGGGTDGKAARAPIGLALAIVDGTTRRVRLTPPVPVHLIDLTAWAERDGTVHFRGASCTQTADGTGCGI